MVPARSPSAASGFTLESEKKPIASEPITPRKKRKKRRKKNASHESVTQKIRSGERAVHAARKEGCGCAVRCQASLLFFFFTSEPVNHRDVERVVDLKLTLENSDKTRAIQNQYEAICHLK